MKKARFLLFVLSATLILTPVSAVYAEESNAIESEESRHESLESETKQTSDESVMLAVETPVLDTAYENKNVYAFVKRMYEIVLGRSPEEDGLKYWYDSLTLGTNEGAEIINGFFFSEEFQNAGHSDEEYIYKLYRALFNREADSEGFKTWMDALNNGMSRRYVCAGFVGSVEYDELCRSYGIVPGTMSTNENRYKNKNITSFVSHFYKYCLGRQGDVNGLNNWTGDLISGRAKGVDIVKGFFFSDEMQNKKLSNEEFVDILYQTLLSRKSDVAGKSDWVGRLNSGVSKQHVICGFVYSSEFTKLCQTYGINRGDMEVSQETRDENANLTAYISRLYSVCFDRKATATELNHWTDRVLNKGILSTELASAFFTSSEYTQKKTDDRTYVIDMYEALLNRRPGNSEIDEWMNKLRKSSREDVLKELVTSKEGHDKCLEAGVAVISTGWVESNGKVYYIENSKRKTGWLTLNGQRYYLNPSKGGEKEIGWEYVDGYKLYFNSEGQLVQDVEYLIGPQDSYFIKVYKWANYLIVYAKDGDNGYTIPVKAMITSCGNNTPTGNYYTPNKFRWLTMVGGSKAQWCTQISGDYLFHSVPYRIADNSTLYTDIMYNLLGTTQSLGCIRLQAGDAKWIYDNCELGTHVNIDPNVNQGPFDKPAFEPIPTWHTWDPTDPTAKYLCTQHGCH